MGLWHAGGGRSNGGGMGAHLDRLPGHCEQAGATLEPSGEGEGRFQSHQCSED